MSNKYWIDKTDGVDTILAENFNSAFAGIESDITSVDASLERIKYYGSADIIPSDESYFTVNETGETIIGLTDTGKTQTELVIPYKINGIEITGIGGLAFSGRTSLTSITIPNSVISIGTAAFGDCRLLKSINIPNSVTSMESDVFNGCTSLTSINIPNSVTSIEIATFYNCSALTSINIPNSVTNIAADAFVNCTNLTIYCEQGSYAETYAKTNNIPVMYTDISATDFNNKADKATTLDGYGITDAYTKTEVDTKDSALKDDISELKQKSIPHTTVSDYPISASDHLEGESVIDYKVYGNSVQDGTPSPENPVEIQSVGDLVTDETSEYYGKYVVPIKISGKNLLSKWYSNMHYSGCTKSKAIYMEPGTYNYHFDRVDDTVTKWRYALSIFDVDGGENDRLTNVSSYLTQPTTNKWYCNDYGIVQSTGDITYSGAANVALTILKPCYIMWMLQLKNSSGTILDAKKYAKNVMLEKGDQYTGYEDYIEPITKNIYLDEPLRKVGDYADYIDYKNQKVVRNVNYIVFTEKNEWVLEKQSEDYLRCYMMLNKKQLGVNNILSNTFNVGASSSDINTIYGRANNKAVSICLSTEYAATIEEFKAFITERYNTGTPIICYYQLETPIEESIIVPNLTTPNSALLNVSAETITSPSKIDLTYYQDINKKLAELQEAITALGGI